MSNFDKKFPENGPNLSDFQIIMVPVYAGTCFLTKVYFSTIPTSSPARFEPSESRLSLIAQY